MTIRCYNYIHNSSVVYKLNEFNKLVMTYRRIVNFSLIVLFIVSGCAGLDDFIEIPLEGPLVLFHCDTHRNNSDTLVLIGIKDPNIYEGLQSIPMRFYLKNNNNELSIINGSSKKVSSFLPFARINAETAVKFNKDLPELKGMTVFGLYLQGMKMDGKELEHFKALKDGTYRNISKRNAQMINHRGILFVSSEVDIKQSLSYKKLLDNTFTVKQ